MNDHTAIVPLLYIVSEHILVFFCDFRQTLDSWETNYSPIYFVSFRLRIDSKYLLPINCASCRYVHV